MRRRLAFALRISRPTDGTTHFGPKGPKRPRFLARIPALRELAPTWSRSYSVSPAPREFPPSRTPPAPISCTCIPIIDSAREAATRELNPWSALTAHRSRSSTRTSRCRRNPSMRRCPRRRSSLPQLTLVLMVSTTTLAAPSRKAAVYSPSATVNGHSPGNREPAADWGLRSQQYQPAPEPALRSERQSARSGSRPSRSMAQDSIARCRPAGKLLITPGGYECSSSQGRWARPSPRLAEPVRKRTCRQRGYLLRAGDHRWGRTHQPGSLPVHDSRPDAGWTEPLRRNATRRLMRLPSAAGTSCCAR